ncbi:MAG: flagellar filament capping protein FliD [Deltaproteobacteria bacterium]|nr:flagellar filament capping protein FliD [Deltaproteobacteria bacterium]
MAGNITFPGIGSGIDGSQIASAVKEQYTIQNKVRTNQVSNLADETTALEKLRTLLLDVADKLDGMRTVSGGASIKDASSANEAIVKVAADSSAQSGTFAITVKSLAQSASGSFDRGFDSSKELILQDPADQGNLSFTVGTGKNSSTFSVAVGATTTAEGFVSEFNKQAAGKASASLVNVGTESDPSYRIMFSTKELGTEKGSISVAAENEDLLAAGGLGSMTLDQATDAEFQISGISGTIKRATNSISDVVPGVTVQLQSEGTTVVSVESQAGVDTKQVEAFIGAYNNLVEFINTEDAVTVSNVNGENVNQYGALAKTNIDNDALSSLRSALLGAQSESGDLVFSSLGISTQRDGTLSFDKAKFEQVVARDGAGAAQILTNVADKIGGVSGVVHGFTGYDLAIDREIAGNKQETEQLNETVSRVERSASEREQAMLRQFSGLEGLLAKLNSQASALTRILQF